MFDKRIEELTNADIERVVSEHVQEGAEVEFKETLPSKKGDDPWVLGQDRIGDYARNELISEIIAFANTHGGTLILGVAETKSKPASARAIKPVRNCTELAERLRLQCRDCVEPQIPLLDVAGVPIRRDGSGVIVFKVPSSRMAPHRHTVNKECFIRRADRTEKMTMREIQDLTLQLERGLAAIEQRFVKHQEMFSEQFRDFKRGHEHAFGMRATLIPITPLHIEKVHRNDAVLPPLKTLFGTITGGDPHELFVPFRVESWGPVLRGARGIGGGGDEDDFRIELSVYRDGLMEYVLMLRVQIGNANELLRLYPQWLMGFFGNALCAAEKFRRAANAPSVEYGLEFEIINRGATLPIGRYGSGHDFGRWLGPLPDESSIVFPRYSIGPPHEFQEISQVFERDFWNAAGHDWDELITVDYQRAFQD